MPTLALPTITQAPLWVAASRQARWIRGMTKIGFLRFEEDIIAIFRRNVGRPVARNAGPIFLKSGMIAGGSRQQTGKSGKTAEKIAS